jgi:hypothetical protein
MMMLIERRARSFDLYQGILAFRGEGGGADACELVVHSRPDAVENLIRRARKIS